MEAGFPQSKRSEIPRWSLCNLISEVTCHHFCHLLLVTQNNPGAMWGGKGGSNSPRGNRIALNASLQSLLELALRLSALLIFTSLRVSASFPPGAQRPSPQGQHGSQRSCGRTASFQSSIPGEDSHWPGWVARPSLWPVGKDSYLRKGNLRGADNNTAAVGAAIRGWAV